MQEPSRFSRTFQGGFDRINEDKLELKTLQQRNTSDVTPQTAAGRSKLSPLKNTPTGGFLQGMRAPVTLGFAQLGKQSGLKKKKKDASLPHAARKTAG